MTRVSQRYGTRGSLKWMQRIVMHEPEMLTSAIRRCGGIPEGESITWLSPREDDDFAEYRDGDFLDTVGLGRLRQQLIDFWPRRGPQWDALGLGSQGTVVLVEAKAHLSELGSTCQASPASRAKIDAAFESVKAEIGARPDANWHDGFYQYANRLAHLAFLRRSGVKAILVFLYFTNDADMNGPVSTEEWLKGLDQVRAHLGLPADYKKNGVFDVFIDTREMVTMPPVPPFTESRARPGGL